MAMKRYGKGDLCGLTFGMETNYGVPSDSASMYHGGVVTAYDPDPGIEYDEVVDCGKRTMGKKYISKRDVTASISFRMGKDVSLVDWMEYVLGSGTATDLYQTPKSRTVHIKIASGDHDTLLGANVDKFTIASEELGKAVLFTADLFAKDVVENGATYNNYGKTISKQTPVRSFSKWVCTDSSIGTVNSGKWTLTIAQNLQKVAGSNGEITLGSGEEPYLGNPEVTLEITIPASSRKWDLLRLEGRDGLTFTTDLGDAVITLSGCMIGGKGPSRTSDPYDETVTIEATNITVASKVSADD